MFKELGVPTDLAAHFLLLGQHDLFRHGSPSPGRTASLPSRSRWGTRSSPAWLPRTSGSAPTESSRAGTSTSGKPSASSGNTLPAPRWRWPSARPFGQDIGYNAVPPEVYRGFGFDGAEDLGNMFPVQARLQRLLLRSAEHRVLALLEPGTPDPRSVAGQEQGPHSDGVGQIRSWVTVYPGFPGKTYPPRLVVSRLRVYLDFDGRGRLTPLSPNLDAHPLLRDQ